MSVFVHAQGIKIFHAGGRGGVKKWQNSVHVVVECPLIVNDFVYISAPNLATLLI